MQNQNVNPKLRNRLARLLLYNRDMLKMSSGAAFALVLCAAIGFGQSEQHMRKYKPETPPAHIEVTVTKAFNGKPVANAAVIFHPLKNGKDEGNLEIKTNHEGIATLDLIPPGENVRLQVVADGFQTFGQDYTLAADNKIDVKLQKPAKQSSIYDAPDHPPAAK